MQFDVTREYLDKLIDVIEKKDSKKAIEMMDGLFAADIAEVYDELNIKQAQFLFLLLDGSLAADVIAELEDDDRERFLEVLPSDVIAQKFIHHMDTDDAADVMADLSEEKKDEVLSHLKDLEHAGDIVDLLKYDEDTAGGMMAKELITININWNVEKCIEEIRVQAEEIDEVYYVYVVDDDDILIGTLSLKRLILSKHNTSVSDIYNDDLISVREDTDDEEVANIADKYDLVSLPVVDSIGRLKGKISIDDVVDIIREEADRDYQLASGITDDIEPTDSILTITKARLPWLLIGMIGGVLGAQVIGIYEGDLAKHAVMAFFIPLIAAMGGNVGVQSASIVVQGLANDSLGIESTGRKVFKEFSVAFINGTVCAIIIFLYNLVFSNSLALTLTVSLSLFIVIIIASVFGTFVPLALHRYKIDPALATGPFITTMNDIVGLFIYLIAGRIIFSMF